MATLLERVETELNIRDASPQTIKTYCFFIKKFLEFAKKEPEQLGTEDVKAYLAALVDKRNPRRLSARSKALAQSALRFLFEKVLQKAVDFPESIGYPKALPIVLTKEEVATIIKAAENPKHQLLIELLYSGGLRISEALNLKVKDLELDTGQGWVRRGKGDKDRVFYLPERLRSKLAKVLKGKDQESYLFPGRNGPLRPRAAQTAIKAIAQKAGIKKDVSPHTFRHSFATHLLEDGIDIRKIQELLGHQFLDTTQIYTRVSSTELKKIKNPLDTLVY